MIKKQVIYFYNKTLTIEHNPSLTYVAFEIKHIEPLLSNITSAIRIQTPFVEKYFSELSSYFTLIEAAGGLIVNSNQEWLMIYRLNHWDLPKGKIDHNESAFETAVREIKEECSISVNPKKSTFLTTTYHIYSLNETLILKRTYWFIFFVESSSKGIPQKEENIEKIEWINTTQWNHICSETYLSIVELIKQTFNLKNHETF